MIAKISTFPIVIAAIISHLYANGIATEMAPMEIPVVVMAEPTSNSAF